MMTITQTAAVVAGLAIIASTFVITGEGRFCGLAAAVGLAILAAASLRPESRTTGRF
jgi:hypothetical protein